MRNSGTYHKNDFILHNNILHPNTFKYIGILIDIYILYVCTVSILISKYIFSYTIGYYF